MKRTRLAAKRGDADVDNQLSGLFAELGADSKAAFMKAAEIAGVPIDEDNIITISSAGALFMIAGRIGLEQMTLDEMNAGVDIGFILVLTPSEAIRHVPNGFYSIRMSGNGRATLSDGAGKIVAELPLKATRLVEPTKGSNRRVRPLLLGISAHYDDDSGCTSVDVTLTIFYRQFGFEVLVCPE